MDIVVGSRGMIGSAIGRKLDEHEMRWHNADERLEHTVFFGRYGFDADRIFFCAAPTDVNRYESDSRTVLSATLQTVLFMDALLLSNPKAHLTFVSSSYVFWQDTEPKQIGDKRYPMNLYGVCKSLVEDAVLQRGGSVVRTSGVFGKDYRRMNFVDRILHCETYNNVATVWGADEVLNWTHSDYFADVLLGCSSLSCESALGHIAGPALSRSQMASMVVQRMVELGHDAPLLDIRQERPAGSALRPTVNILKTIHKKSIKEMLEDYIK